MNTTAEKNPPADWLRSAAGPSPEVRCSLDDRACYIRSWFSDGSASGAFGDVPAQFGCHA